MTQLSFSRLETFQKCPKLFEYKYVIKDRREESFSEALFIGQHTHTLLEKKLGKGELVDEVFSRLLPSWLDDIKVYISDDYIDNLLDLSMSLSHILYRCAANYKGAETPIRKKDGTVLKDPVKYPSTEFKKEVHRLGYSERISMAHQEFSLQNHELSGVNICWSLAQIYYLASSFKIPKQIAKTLHVELNVNDPDINTPNNNHNILGYIDWIAELVDGRIAVIDHKTSTEVPTPSVLKTHPQLNLYAYCYLLKFGKLPDLIGINHLKSRQLMLTPVNEDIMWSVVEHIDYLGECSINGPYPKKFPHSYQSPCLKKYPGSSTIIEKCPYIDTCWPNEAKLMQEE